MSSASAWWWAYRPASRSWACWARLHAFIWASNWHGENHHAPYARFRLPALDVHCRISSFIFTHHFLEILFLNIVYAQPCFHLLRALELGASSSRAWDAISLLTETTEQPLNAERLRWSVREPISDIREWTMQYLFLSRSQNKHALRIFYHFENCLKSIFCSYFVEPERQKGNCILVKKAWKCH